MPKPYNTIIIGAGIAGASLAHALTKENYKVFVLDKKGIASGGSGAAGVVDYTNERNITHFCGSKLSTSLSSFTALGELFFD